jgi:hypothetical protein
MMVQFIYRKETQYRSSRQRTVCNDGVCSLRSVFQDETPVQFISNPPDLMLSTTESYINSNINPPKTTKPRTASHTGDMGSFAFFSYVFRSTSALPLFAASRYAKRIVRPGLREDYFEIHKMTDLCELFIGLPLLKRLLCLIERISPVYTLSCHPVLTISIVKV